MKILAYTSPARGHLYPLVPILDELAGRGHRIAVRTLASEVELMSDRGFDAAPIAAAIEAIEHDDYRARTPPAKLKRGMATFGKRSAHEVADLRAAIDAEQPDAILVDCMAWGATAVAESWGGPWAQWFPFPPGDDLARRPAVRSGPQARRWGRRSSSRLAAAPDAGRRAQASVLPGP